MGVVMDRNEFLWHPGPAAVVNAAGDEVDVVTAARTRYVGWDTRDPERVTNGRVLVLDTASGATVLIPLHEVGR